MKKLVGLMASAALLVSTSIANAAPIVGTIDINPWISNAATVTHDGSTAQYIDFARDGDADGIFVADGTGDFAAIIGSFGSIADIDLDPFAGVDPLWSVAGFTFSLDAITLNKVVVSGGVTEVNLAGTGTIKAAGYDDTTGGWTMSLDTTGGTFNWSSTVPEPASLALMGLGLLGLGAVSRRRRS